MRLAVLAVVLLIWLMDDVGECHGKSLFERNLDTVLAKHDITLEEFNTLRLKNVFTLSDSEIETLKSIRESITMPDNTTVMQKVIPKSDINKYLDGTYTQIGSFVTRVDDVTQLNTYNDIYNSLRLDYPNTAYNFISDDSLAVIRYTTEETDRIGIPFSSEFGGITTGEPPFTGNGFTKSTNGQIIPEYICNGFLNIDDGAQLYEIGKDGTESLRAVYSELQGKFIEIK